ncbi:replication initiation and membrane attachment family protein [Lentibacillus sp. CBA3610]|uniref:replication initiation and membrane attachment family protein n=1 Tax=Lentibacillus sp. CBA3610 TaxID=2518176 RepID=UPI0015956B4D|nr:DnaD domain protein [Lentibacillus sp. CBA3610]QKY69647.1 chromosome replication initiation protein [Lentibacillus sp. CBA3610]
MRDIGKILPIEGYRVLLKGSLPADYTKSLTHLYQPLVGIQAVSLYQTLINERDFQEDSTARTHHTLMNYMNAPLDEIYRARRKLEGIGLLKTYQQDSSEHHWYTYEMQPPFAPDEFFVDDMLTQLLYHHIGEAKFTMLQEHFRSQSPEKGTNITASFNEVFQTFQPHAEGLNLTNDSQTTEENMPSIDFSWMEQMLQSRMIPVKKVMTTTNKRLISQMMTLYDLAEFEVEKAVLWALTEENSLVPKEFKEACHDLFQNKHQQATIRLTGKTEDEAAETDYKPTTKEEQLILKLEKISPKQLLEDLSSGGQASGQDLKMIREVMTTQGLPSPVMNVLIHYVLLQSDMKLSKAYMETIASHWSRSNLKTAREAMAFAKNQKSQYQQRQNNKSKNYRKPASKEVVPDWFKERKKKKPAVQQNSADAEQANEEFAALLREFSNGKQ